MVIITTTIMTNWKLVTMKKMISIAKAKRSKKSSITKTSCRKRRRK